MEVQPARFEASCRGRIFAQIAGGTCMDESLKAQK